MILLLGLTAVFTGVSLLCYFKRKEGPAIAALMGAGLCLRLVMIKADPFLHDFDEKYHALVAKNMLADWLTPLLRARPVLAYDYQTWCCNHVWVHKQPLFLWQMAGSMHLFGVNEVAVRLPSAVLSTLLIWPMFRLGKIVAGPSVGYGAALLLTFAHYQLELVSGWQSVDHNDIAFMVYVTGSIWAYAESQQPGANAWRWSLLVGLLAGAAVLCKWLPGLVVFVGWTLDVLLTRNRRQHLGEYLRLGVAALLAGVVFLPWQFYIHARFPVESGFEQQYAARHFWEVMEGKDGPWYFYLKNMWYQYQWMVVPIGVGLIMSMRLNRAGLRPLLFICGAVFVFFSLAATKMPSYTYVVSPVLLLLGALACVAGVKWLQTIQNRVVASTVLGLLGATLLWINLRPDALLKHHTERFAKPVIQAQRREKLRHTAIYRQLDSLVPAGYVVFNAPPLEENEAMFYSSRNVYSWWPTEPEIQKLRAKGVRIAAFADHGQQVLPAYLRESWVRIIAPPLDGKE